MKKFLTFLILMCSISIAHTQKNIVTQENAWLVLFGNHRINERWGFNTEYQLRRAEILQQPQQSLIRFGLDYYSKENIQLTVGYAWIKTEPYGSQPIVHTNREHRLWQQMTSKDTWGRVALQHRYRLEQRFIEDWRSSGDGPYERMGYLYRQRIRYRLFITVPLSRQELSDNTLFLAASNEVFLGFGRGIAKNVLDQNRLYCGFGWRFNAACTIQIGYLNQYIIKKDGNSAERNHTAQCALTYNLDFREWREIK
jgi:hypothetical protein